jgi:hypothetical protein
MVVRGLEARSLANCAVHVHGAAAAAADDVVVVVIDPVLVASRRPGWLDPPD